MIEHQPWVGPRYKDGINEQRIAILGHSHHASGPEDDPDSDSATIDCMRHIIAGEWSFKFFNEIQKYFGFDSDPDLWNRVVFMNYLPERVEKLRDGGTTDQLDRANKRFLKMLAERKPQKVFVFTKKGWDVLPQSIENEEGSRNGDRPLSPEFPHFRWCTYKADNQTIYAYALPHPERANAETSRRVLEHILVLPVATG